MTEVRAALVGACGRMGTMIVRHLMATEGITVSAAFDIVNVGKDIGEVAGIGKIDVPVSESKDLASVLKESKTDVLIDFTIAAATAVNAPAAAAAPAPHLCQLDPALGRPWHRSGGAGDVSVPAQHRPPRPDR